MSWTASPNKRGGELITAAVWNANVSGNLRTSYRFGDPAPEPQHFAHIDDFAEAYKLWHRAQRTRGADPIGALLRDEVRRIRKEQGLE